MPLLLNHTSTGHSPSACACWGTTGDNRKHVLVQVFGFGSLRIPDLKQSQISLQFIFWRGQMWVTKTLQVMCWEGQNKDHNTSLESIAKPYGIRPYSVLRILLKQETRLSLG